VCLCPFACNINSSESPRVAKGRVGLAAVVVYGRGNEHTSCLNGGSCLLSSCYTKSTHRLCVYGLHLPLPPPLHPSTRYVSSFPSCAPSPSCPHRHHPLPPALPPLPPLLPPPHPPPPWPTPRTARTLSCAPLSRCALWHGFCTGNAAFPTSWYFSTRSPTL
jgi:hypothetical protein